MEVAVRIPMTKKGQDDFSLVEQAKKGCQQSFARLMERHQSAVFHLMLRMTKDREDANDLTLEAFGKAFTRLGSYAPNYAFSTWLYKIAVNNGIDFVRRKRLQLLSIDNAIDAGEGDQDFRETLRTDHLDPEQFIIRKQRIELMRRCMDQLTDKYRQMLEMRYDLDLSYEEIAAELNVPLGTVKAQLFRAKELLGELLLNRGCGAYMESPLRRRAC
jgi:RNA polymerase sigma-70 factor (ECF subfamily)